jgi:hypothetical protein
LGILGVPMERKNMEEICVKMNKWTFMKKEWKNTRGYHEVILKLFQNWLLKVEFKYEHYDIELNNSFSTPNKRGGNCEKIVNQEI